MCFKSSIINEVDYRKGLFYMKNTYLTGYFPLIAILLFSSSLSISTSLYALKML
ncbi:hypothetical protein MOC06_16420, partial [Bacillus inaquosorum]|nr:hypothetical protein [Bacillus inaquosorum]